MKLRIVIPQIEYLLDSQHMPWPALMRLMVLGDHTIIAEPLEVLLCRGFGVSRHADWPLAALSWYGEKGEVGEGYWLRADPVHLALQRDSFTLSHPVPLPLAHEDSRILIDLLNQHFTTDGLQFHLADSGAWFMHMDTPPGISTTLPVTAAGHDINFHMPEGADAKTTAKWSRLLNEIQMLLHDHPVNQAREAAGQLAVNSIWLSGGGILPTGLKSGADAMFSDNYLTKGLAALADIPLFDLPEKAQTVFEKMSSASNAWVILDNLKNAEYSWFAPALASLRAGKIKQLTLDFAVRGQVLSVDVRPAAFWKFWRKPKPLLSYFMAKS